MNKAQKIADQIDPKLTKEYLDVIRRSTCYKTHTAEETIQDIMDFKPPFNYYIKLIEEEKKEIAKNKRIINNSRTKLSTKNKARTKRCLAECRLTIYKYYSEVTKLLEQY